MHVVAIVPAAGLGLRLKKRISKPLVKISGVPIIIRTLKALANHPLIEEIILVVNPSNISAIKSAISKYRINRISAMVIGGATRRISVERGLSCLKESADLVLIHDAVRPFIKQEAISRVIRQARKSGAAIVGVAVKATIKKIRGQQAKTKIVEKTVKREGLWEIQTPQVFRKDWIIAAYKRFKDKQVTDDAMLVERLGKKVHLVPGSYENIKITTPEDLVIARAILQNGWKG